VKKSKYPWLIFKKSDNKEHSKDHWINPSYTKYLGFKPVELSEVLGEYSLRYSLGWLGYGIHEAFKKPSEASRWYSSAVTAIKAAEHHKKIYSEIGNLNFSSFLLLCTPVIVLDNTLCSATLDGNRDIEINEIPFATLDFEFMTEKYQSGNYRVDIVQLSRLDEYITFQEIRSGKIYETQCKNVNKG